MSRLPIVLVGAGAMGANHARVIAGSDAATLALVVDIDIDRARSLAEPLGAAWAPELPDDLPGRAAVVASPTESHAAVASILLDRGVPLLVEKPLTPDLRTTLAMVERAAAGGVPLMCGFVERFNPAFRTAAELLDEAPTHVVSVRHSPPNDRIVTGVVHDLLIHDLDLAVRLCGEPARVSATGWSPKVGAVHEVVDALVTFASGAVANCSSDRWSQRKVRSLSIASGRQLIEVDLLRQDVTVFRHVHHEIDAAGQYRADTVVDIPFVRHTGEPLALQLDRFVSLVGGRVDATEEGASVVAAHQLADDVCRVLEAS